MYFGVLDYVVHFTVRPEIIRICEFLYKKLYWVSVQGTGSRGLQGGLCEEKAWPPCARHSQFQLVPQRTHRRAQLSPSAKMVAPLGKRS